jgi:hypothetical protein
MPLVCKERYASEAMSMSDQDNWEFVDPDDAKSKTAPRGIFAESLSGNIK